MKYGAQLPTGHSTMHCTPSTGPHPGFRRCHRLRLSRRRLGRRDRRGRSRSVECGSHHRLGQAVLASAASDVGWGRVHQLHDGGGTGSSPCLVPRKLRPAVPGEGAYDPTTSFTSTRTFHPLPGHYRLIRLFRPAHRPSNHDDVQNSDRELEHSRFRGFLAMFGRCSPTALYRRFHGVTNGIFYAQQVLAEAGSRESFVAGLAMSV